MKNNKRLLKRFAISRFNILLLLLLFELVALFLPHFLFIKNNTYYWIANVINILCIIYIINVDKNPHYKLAWITLIAITPGVGAIIYLIFADKKIPKNLRSEFFGSFTKGQNFFPQKDDIVKPKDSDIAQQLNYVSNNAYYPYYQNSKVTYFKLGEDLYYDLIEEIKKAKRFIFLEFFIVSDGKLLEGLLEILAKKVREGVEVNFMYDDAGSIAKEPVNFKQRLTSLGIHVVAFSPLSSLVVLTPISNLRDHRKICVVDNKVAYTGGINVADEYVNLSHPYGHWKDTGIKVEGEAVISYTISFIQFFNVYSSRHLIYEDYLHKAKEKIVSSSYVLPFSDSPTDKEAVGKTVHYNMISRAKKYIYIQTPYLIIDDVLQNALCSSSKNGVEVIITVPHIPDKKSVFMVTRSNYYKLLKAGVKIYEYTPGFIHSKLCLSDDKIVLEGTINMDFRSYYLNYEFGTLVANDPCIKEMKKDYLKTLEASKEITLEEVKKTKLIVRLFRAIMNVFAPLL